MHVRLMAIVSKHVLAAMFAILLASNPAQTKAQQLAQGEVQATITVSTTAAITSATCDLGINTYVTVDASTGTILSFSTDNSIAATIQGGTVSCVVTTPYYWSVPSLANSKIGISYSVNAQNPTTLVTKSTSGTFVPIPLSTTGITAFNVTTVF